MKNIRLLGFIICSLWLLQTTGCNEDTIEISETGSLQGVVLNIDNNAPVPEAEITTIPTSKTVYTDSSGTFTLSDIKAMEYTVRISKTDFEPFSKVLTIEKNETRVDTLFINKDPESISTVTNPSPDNQARDIPLSVTLSWQDNNNQKAMYELVVFESNMDQQFANVSELSEPSYTLEGLSYETTYYWQVNVKSDKSEKLTNGPVWNFTTAKFPDNNFIFSHVTSGNYDLYSSNQDSASLVQVTSTPQTDWYPQWNQNRESIAFSSIDNGEFYIYTIDNKGTGRTKVSSLPLAGNYHNGEGFTWSPSYDAIAFSSYNKLYEIDKDGDDLRLLTTAPANRTFRALDWTDIGNKIVIETVGAEPYTSEIRLYYPATNNLDVLIPDLPGVMKSPIFTIQGDKVIFTRDSTGFESASGRMLNSQIQIIDIATKDITNLSKNKPAGTNDLMPRLSPTGAQLIFVNAPNNDITKGSIWIMNIDGSERQKIFESGLTPDWR